MFFHNQPGVLTNSGSINATGVNGAGVYLENDGTVTNNAGASMTGAKFGAFIEGGFGTLANYGVISGASYDGVVLGLEGSSRTPRGRP